MPIDIVGTNDHEINACSIEDLSQMNRNTAFDDWLSGLDEARRAGLSKNEVDIARQAFEAGSARRAGILEDDGYGQDSSRLARLLAQRDTFIVRQGQWSLFVDSLPRETGDAHALTEVVAPGELLDLTFAIQYNPNCYKQWLVRLVRKGALDLLPYVSRPVGKVETNDILGFGNTLLEAATSAIDQRNEFQKRRSEAAKAAIQKSASVR